MKNLQKFKDMQIFVNNLKTLSEHTLTRPLQPEKWSTREVILHLYYWDQFILEHMADSMEHGAVLVKFPEHDSYNAEGLEKLQGVSALESIELFSLSRKALYERLAVVDPAVRFTIGTGKRTFSTESFNAMFVKHDLHHRKQIVESLGIHE